MAKCCVPRCKNTYDTSSGEISYHLLPKTNNEKIRKQWIDKICIPPSKITRYSTVCSAHFKPEDFQPPFRCNSGTRPYKRLHQHAVPSIFAPLPNQIKSTQSNADLPEAMEENVQKMGNKNVSARSKTPLTADWYKQKIKKLKLQLSEANSKLKSQKLSTDKMQNSIALITAENERLKNLSAEEGSDKLTKKFLTSDIIKNDSNLVKFYTGFKNSAAYSAFFRQLQTRAEIASFINTPFQINVGDVLSAEDAFFLTLLRLKLGFPAEEVARIFGISVDSVDHIFTTWINFLNREMQELITIPYTQSQPNSTLMLDCIEIGTSSEYDANKICKPKVLVAVTLKGKVCFVSDVVEESASFRAIVEKSGFLNLGLLGNENIKLITDKGSEITDLLPAGVSVNICKPDLDDIIQKVKSNRFLDSFLFDVSAKSIPVCAMLINFK